MPAAGITGVSARKDGTEWPKPSWKNNDTKFVMMVIKNDDGGTQHRSSKTETQKKLKKKEKKRQKKTQNPWGCTLFYWCLEKFSPVHSAAFHVCNMDGQKFKNAKRLTKNLASNIQCAEFSRSKMFVKIPEKNAGKKTQCRSPANPLTGHIDEKVHPLSIALVR